MGEIDAGYYSGTSLLSVILTYMQEEVSAGFSLIEVLVIISIITIFSVLTATSLPIARNRQNIQLAGQQVSAMLSEAIQRAINETREESCLEGRGEAIKCSDVGVHIAGTTITMFADTVDDNKFSDGDAVIKTQTLSGNAISPDDMSIVFEAAPPSVIAFGNGNVITPDGQQATFSVSAGSHTSTYRADAYGHLTLVSPDSL